VNARIRGAAMLQWLARLLKGMLDSSRLAPVLIRKPAIAWHTIQSAYRAHLALIFAVLFLWFLAPSLTRGIADVVTPRPKTFLGLIEVSGTNAEQTANQILNILWLGAGCWILMMMWSRIPHGIESAARRSELLQRRADQLPADQSEAKVRLYQKALALTTDPDHESSLANRLREFGNPHGGTDQTSITSGLLSRESTGEAHGVSPATGYGRIGESGRYELLTELGRGGMGVVYQGHDTVLNRKVAVKGLLEGLASDGDFVTRFHQEAKALALLAHPCIVQVYDFLEDRGRIWMVLEFIEGGDLAQQLDQVERLPLNDALRLAVHLADALAYAHRQGVVHRDFKPSNVLLGEPGPPKITDFGLAKLLGTSSLTQTGAILGSARYMSPEQAAGKPSDERSDVYSFGTTLYQMVTGRTPYEGEPASVIAQHLTATPPPPREWVPDLPKPLERLILDLLARDPDKRETDLSVIGAKLTTMAGETAAMARIS